MALNIYTIVYTVFEVLIWLIVARALLSWIRHDPSNPIFRFVYDVTEPILKPFRRLMPRRSMVDFSPILAFLALYIVRSLVVQILRMLL